MDRSSSPCRVKNFVFTSPRPVLGPTHFLSNGYRGLFPRGQSGRRVELTTHLHIVPRPIMMELYLHYPICLHEVLLNQWGTGTALPSLAPSCITNGGTQTRKKNILHAFCERKWKKRGPVRIWGVYNYWVFGLRPSSDILETRAVFLNLRAAAQYRALASVLPGSRLIKKEFTGPRSHKNWEPQN
jgi:hypothetical protein